MDTLINKKYPNYGRLSRYGVQPQYFNTTDKKWVNETSKSINKDTTYYQYVVSSGETYDLISLKVYNNPTYFWVICDFNDIKNPLVPPLPGISLKIPVLSKITFSGDIR